MSMTRPSEDGNSSVIGFSELYRDYSEFTYRFCYRLCGNVSDAEDLSRDVLLQAGCSIHQYLGQAKLTTWLAKIAINRWRYSKRHCSMTVPIEDATGIPQRQKVQVDVLLELISIHSALSSLSEPLRRAFYLVRVSGFSHREAAEIMNIPTGTVQWRVHEAVRQIRASDACQL